MAGAWSVRGGFHRVATGTGPGPTPRTAIDQAIPVDVAGSKRLSLWCRNGIGQPNTRLGGNAACEQVRDQRCCGCRSRSGQPALNRFLGKSDSGGRSRCLSCVHAQGRGSPPRCLIRGTPRTEFAVGHPETLKRGCAAHSTPWTPESPCPDFCTATSPCSWAR